MEPAGAEFRFNVHDISQPAVNDNITNAVPVGTFPFTDGSNTITATKDPQDPVCADYQGQTVWYSFTPDTTMRVYATSWHSIYANALSVYSSPTASPLVLKEVACSPGFPEVYFDAKAGMTYFFMVSAHSPVGEGSPLDQGGFLNLLVQEAFRITEFTVDPKATVNGDSTVTLTGTVACNHLLGGVQISGSMAQRGVEGSSTSALAVGNRQPAGARPLRVPPRSASCPAWPRSKLGRLVSIMVFRRLGRAPTRSQDVFP